MHLFNGRSRVGGLAAPFSASVHYLCWACVAALLTSADIHAADALPTDSVFASSSFWYTPIPADAPAHSNSAAFVTEFVSQIKKYYGNVTINTAAYASPVFVVEKDVPAVRVSPWNCQNKSQLDPALARLWLAVPIPDYAKPAGGTDAEMTIYQPSTDTLWEFWVTRRINGEWQACWGGRMDQVSKSDGRWPGFFGATATGLPFIGGQITAEELKRGDIRHAIGIAIVDTEIWSVVSWPARRSDGYNPNAAPNRIPEGLRFRLDPTIDVDALKIHPVAKTIAKAAQKYGFVVWDKAGAISLRAQNPLSYTLRGQPDPYVALFGSTPVYAVLNGFPWSRLQFLPMNFGKP